MKKVFIKLAVLVTVMVLQTEVRADLIAIQMVDLETIINKQKPEYLANHPHEKFAFIGKEDIIFYPSAKYCNDQPRIFSIKKPAHFNPINFVDWGGHKIKFYLNGWVTKDGKGAISIRELASNYRKYKIAPGVKILLYEMLAQKEYYPLPSSTKKFDYLYEIEIGETDKNIFFIIYDVKRDKILKEEKISLDEQQQVAQKILPYII